MNVLSERVGRWVPWRVAALLFVVAVVTTACSAVHDTDDGGRDRTLVVATYDGKAPWAFFSANRDAFHGINADLLGSVARRLGVKLRYQDVAFSSQLPGLIGGRFDLIMSTMGDTAARQRVVDFVDYSFEANSVVVRKGNPSAIRTLPDLCGKRVALITGMIVLPELRTLSAGCPVPIQITEMPNLAGPRLAVASGRADAEITSYAGAAWAFRTARDGVNTEVEVSPVPHFAGAPQGIAVRKSDTRLRDAIRGALQAMIDDGEYGRIFAKWQLPESAIGRATVNTK